MSTSSGASDRTDGFGNGAVVLDDGPATGAGDGVRGAAKESSGEGCAEACSVTAAGGEGASRIMTSTGSALTRGDDEGAELGPSSIALGGGGKDANWVAAQCSGVVATGSTMSGRG